MLGIAYASSIGCVGTLIGTPPNALMAGFLRENYGFEIGFAHWMLVGLPLVIIGLPVCFLLLTKFIFPTKLKILPGGKELIINELKNIGGISNPEKMVAMVFSLVAILWISRPLLTKFIPGWTDAGIAIIGAFILFVLPAKSTQANFLLDWKYAERLPWGILILFGGGLSLASAINRTGLSAWIGETMSVLSSLPIFLMIALLTAVIIFLTELNSNTATAAAFLPLVASIAIAVGQNPLLFVLPVAIAASCAFMLPVATPPNAIVYGSEVFTVPQMARAGIFLNIFFIFLITFLSYTLILIVFDIQIGVIPDWISVK
jgi:sodium-dependent dicarboxylate transporter 2/3/5